VLADVSLADKFTLNEGKVFISGTQALTRVLLFQKQADAAHGINSAGFISGYRGSPLGTLDTSLWRAKTHLEESGIIFQPGVNEELAATAVYGTQQLGFFQGAQYDGVFAAWYGKGPGVDRAGDALKHGNLAGTSAKGGVLVFAGDDHAGKSSTTAHQSEQALVASLIPVLYPASVEEFLEYGAFGYAMSRYSGLWMGFKCINDTADATATARVGNPSRLWMPPADFELPPEGLNIIKGESQLSQEKRTTDFRLPAAQAFARANGLDRVIRDSERRELGIVSAGKAALDVIEALNQLGLDDARCRRLGIRVLKLAMTWPVEPHAIRDFGIGHRQLLVVEEKRAFIEPQVASLLYHLPADRRPALVGKTDEDGRLLLAQNAELTPTLIQRALMPLLERLGLVDAELAARWAELEMRLASASGALTAFNRMPFFCSGCPHNTSTVVPEGAVALSGIGCHVMAALMPHRNHLWPVQMGGEGANWIGIAPFTETAHVFQNLGDGTYHHSGSLAVRAAVAAGISITYKLLFNDAVAMTGGQPVEGQLTPWQIAAELLQEGVKRVVVVADDIDKYPPTVRFPDGVVIRPREELEAVQRELAEITGVTVLIYDQVCAAEKRRRRKKGQFPDPDKRIFINDLVCEGCGDCSVKSNCVSVQPLETEFGRKRQIDQSNCNKDFSCVNGFCPSFVSVEGGKVASKAQSRGARGLDIPPLPDAPAPVDGLQSILITGIGGTGVVTIGAILGMAAHLEGKAASIIDMTGLSQKNGAVCSHLKIAPTAAEIAAARITAAGTDLLLGCDMLTAGGAEAMSLVRTGDTVGVINEDVTPTAAFTIDTSVDFQGAQTIKRLKAVLEPGRSVFVDATRLATRLLGDSIGANMLMVGVALQRGLLPVSLAAVEKAITLNGVAVAANLLALRLGRLAAVDPEAVKAMVADDAPVRKAGSLQLSENLDALIARRVAFLTDYQNAAYAERYRATVDAVRQAEAPVTPATTELTAAVARNLFKLMAYKDEYEVARLYTSGEFESKVKAQFTGDYRLSFHLAPPLFARKDPTTGLPRKMRFGPSMMQAFKLLAKLKGLRGTPFDIFGYSDERRTERQLIADYQAMLGDVLARLTPDNHATAVRLAAVPDQIRGFGHVKERNLAAAEKARTELLQAFAQPAVRTLEAAE
jgi:indolepyruvate ferredoxin oxidoreductase